MLTNEEEIIEDEIVEEDEREEVVDEEESVDDSLESEENDNESDDEDDEEEEDSEESEEDEGDDEDDDHVVVSIGDEVVNESKDESKTPKWVKELRRQNKELKKRNKELERQSAPPAEKKPVVVGDKPTLAGCDYDAAAYEKKLADWYERKREADAQAAEAEAAKKAQEEEQKARIDSYNKSKASLKVKDFEDAESNVTDNFDVTQQGLILHGADNPALVVYALGKNEKKSKELAKIKDPVKFAFAVAKLEAQLKVTRKQSKPAPEKVLKSGNTSGSVDSRLERLREEAARTGDYSKVMQYKNKLKRKR